MPSSKAIFILSFYATSIFGYGLMELSHFLSHQIKNPFHHHAVHAHTHSHSIEDHKISKLFSRENIGLPKAMKVIKALYFFSVYEPSLVLEKKNPFGQENIFCFVSLHLTEINSRPPSPPPDLV